jgi:AraC-like DNA-binding protein
MLLFIKYMVSKRCKLVVISVLQDLGMPFKSVDLGVVELPDTITNDQRARLKITLQKHGLELMDDKDAVMIERIIQTVMEAVDRGEEMSSLKLSEFLSRELDVSYLTISQLFSKIKGMTLEHFYLLQRIEKVKELLLYEKLSLTEIAHQLHYSSTAHLSAQFKKITGLTPTFFMTLHKRKKSLQALVYMA